MTTLVQLTEFREILALTCGVEKQRIIIDGKKVADMVYKATKIDWLNRVMPRGTDLCTRKSEQPTKR